MKGWDGPDYITEPSPGGFWVKMQISVIMTHERLPWFRINHSEMEISAVIYAEMINIS